MSVYGAVPTPAANGTATVFTLPSSSPYAAGTTRVFVNGARLINSAYTESNPSDGQITFNTAPASGVAIEVDYDLQATATTTAEGTWTFNPDGFPSGSAMYFGPVLWLAGSQPGSTGTGACVFGPNGAQIAVPPLAQGEPGQPTTFTFPAPVTLPAGSPATVTPVQTAAGGAGVGASYALTFGIPQGPEGPAFETEILSASDLTGTPAAGYTTVYVPAQGNIPAQVAWAAMPFSSVYNVGSIPNTGTNGGENRTLQTLSIPAQPNLWIPVIFAQSEITGTVNTIVDIVCRQNNGTTAFNGSQWAIGNGVPGPGPTNVATLPASTSLIQGDVGAIPANTATTFYLNAEQQATTTDTYATADTTLWLGVLPVGIIATAGVAVDEIGAGLSVASNTGSFSHTIGANDNYVIVAVGASSTGATSLLSDTPTVTYGGQAMTSLGGAQAGTSGFAELFGLANPPSGAQTIAVSGPSGSGGITGLVVQSVSFNYWSQTSFDYPTGSTSASLATDAVTLNASQIAIAVMVSFGSSAITPTSPSGTTLWQRAAGGGGSINLVLLAATGSGTTVELTGSTTSSQPWATTLVTLI